MGQPKSHTEALRPPLANRRKLAIVLVMGSLAGLVALLSENKAYWRSTFWPPTASSNWLGAPGGILARTTWQTLGFAAPLLPALLLVLAATFWTARWGWVVRFLAATALIPAASLAMALGGWNLSGPVAGAGGSLGAWLVLHDLPTGKLGELALWVWLGCCMLFLVGPALPLYLMECLGSLLNLAPRPAQPEAVRVPDKLLIPLDTPIPLIICPACSPISKVPESDPPGPDPVVVSPPVPVVKLRPKGKTTEEPSIPIHHHATRVVEPPPPEPPAAQRPKDASPAVEFAGYEVPGLEILDEPEAFQVDRHEELLRDRATLLEQAFRDYGIHVKVVGINTGPVITQFEISLETGLRLNKVTRLGEDIALNLRVSSVRMVAPIPGKNTVGVEIPNELRATVRLKEVIGACGRKVDAMKIPLFLGKDNEGRPLVHDLADMPHLLIAGSTGTGKSVCMNSIILSMLMTRRPDQVRMIMIDPKVVELTDYARIPHLMHPVVHDMKKAEAILAWAVDKMEERYECFRRARVRNLAGYNELDEKTLLERVEPATDEEREKLPRRMPYIVVFIDEMADLMMTMRKEVEGHIIRLAQKSRAAGIHLVVATQKPTVDVITGLIKSNLPSRICFKVVNKSDSRVVLDEMGADRLLGKGDMLFLPPGTSVVARAQGTFASDGEIRRIVAGVVQVAPSYIQELVQLPVDRSDGKKGENGEKKERDAVFDAAVEIVVREGRGSTSLLQRALGIGYGRAARLIDQMAEEGVVGSFNGSSAREVLITAEEWESRCAAALR